jgi:predicted O-methyltransferase YrrM
MAAARTMALRRQNSSRCCLNSLSFAAAASTGLRNELVMLAATATITLAARLLDNILRDGCVRAEDGTVMSLHSHLPREAGQMLQRIIHDLDARTTLEIGMAFGISTLFICEALTYPPDDSNQRRSTSPPPRHIAIDPNQHDSEWCGIGLRHVRLAGFADIVDFRELPSHQALPDLEREGVRIDFAFVDGWHTFDYVMVDLFLIDRLLRVGGVVVVDDADWPGVIKACRYFITNRAYRVVECWQEHRRASPRQSARRAIREAARRMPVLRRPLKPEWSIPDERLGLIPGARCVALRKTVEDDGRLCFGHEEF